MTEDITLLKAQIQEYESKIKMYNQWIAGAQKHLSELRERVDNTVVDGLRMKVREFIPSIKRMGYKIRLLRRPAVFSSRNEPWLTGNPNYLDTESGLSIEITEEEALFLSSKEGRQAYNIDCSIWDTYRDPGEID